MRKASIVPLLVLFFSFSLLSGAFAEGEQIAWVKSLKEAQKKAEEEKKLIMVDFYASWCVPCHILEKTVLSKKDVIEASRSFVSLRLDIDQNKAMINKYQVGGFPTVLFLNTCACEVHRIEGFKPKDEFVATMRKLIENKDKLNDRGRVLDKNRADPDCLNWMADFYCDMDNFSGASDALNLALKKNPDMEPVQKEVLMLKMARCYIKAEDYRNGVKVYTKLKDEFNGSEQIPEYMIEMAQTYILWDKTPKAVAILDEVISEYPESKAAAKAKEVMEGCAPK
jgi:thioredoxin-related protein